MKKSWISVFSVIVVAAFAVQGADPGDGRDSITVASYYFGNYHPNDPRNEKAKGKGWSEWELVKAARPRFPGHEQPHVPLWGYTDESDPRVMAGKIQAAADHGIDAFIFDWYHYNDGPFLDRPIDEGFLRATNNHRIKFAFMWANHDWIDLFPYKRGTPQNILYPGAVTPETFERICDHLIQDYFQHPSYWRIEGKPYFSFYHLTKLMEGFGSAKATRAALDKFREKARAAGLPGLHLNAVTWGKPILPGENKAVDPGDLVKDLGFDSVTSYVWVHHVALPRMQTDYNEARDQYFSYWNKAETLFGVPYIPNVTMGWDPSPRTHKDDEFGNFGYPFTHTISGNTPERFREALLLTRKRLLDQKSGPRILNINCWNEWTEGSYLEPDAVHGMKYLEAVRDVFGSAEPQAPRAGSQGKTNSYAVAAYYWPAYHDEPRWRPFFNGTEGEWDIIRHAQPKFPGHNQPRVPLWGYEDESDPKVMEKKIDAAARHGVNVFIFDWYWFDGKPFLEDCLNEGFLKATNCAQVGFYLMWANHDATTLWSLKRSHTNELIWPAAVDRKTFDAIADRVIEKYFKQPSYFKIDGKPVFSIYEMSTLVKGLGGISNTRAALDGFREKAKAAGFPGVHFQAILWASIPESLSDVPGDRTKTQDNTIRQLGFDSLSNYQWCHLVVPKGDYAEWGRAATAKWEPWAKEFSVPYFPHVSIDWDSNPRVKALRPNIIENKSPEAFAEFLRKAKEFVDRHDLEPRLITINSWNEWSEGSYLEPDTQFEMRYLEAVKKVFTAETTTSK